MKAVKQSRPEVLVLEIYARSDLRHFKEAWPGEQRSSVQGEGIGHYRGARGVQFAG